MPQVSGADHANLKAYLTRKGISYKDYSENPNKLNPTQSEFNVEKVNHLIKNFDEVKDKKILVSKDNRVIDGHHRWLAALKVGSNINIIKINKRYDNVLDVLAEFPKVFSKSIKEEKDNSDE